MNPPELVNQLVTENFNLCRFWARKFEYLFGYNDALSIAMRGLLSAAQKYEERRGIPFGTYGSVRIKWEFSREKYRMTALRRGGDYKHVSFDKALFHDSNRTLGDELADDAPDPASILGESESHADIRAMLALLPERTQRIMEMRYGLTGNKPCLLEEIAKRFKLTRERVRQIEAGALRKFWRDKRRKKLEPVVLARRVA